MGYYSTVLRKGNEKTQDCLHLLNVGLHHVRISHHDVVLIQEVEKQSGMWKDTIFFDFRMIYDGIINFFFVFKKYDEAKVLTDNKESVLNVTRLQIIFSLLYTHIHNILEAGRYIFMIVSQYYI